MAPTSICRHCGTEFSQPGIGRPRVFCSAECRIEHWNKRSVTGARSQDHKMSEVDPVARIGTCTKCGPETGAYRSTRGKGGDVRWRCRNRIRAQPSMQVKKWPPKDPIARKLNRWRREGINITSEEYAALLADANGHCQICGREADPLHLDHCHETGEWRGLLCSPCNTSLGKFGDDIEAIQRVVAYLEAFLARQGALVD